MTTIVLPAHAFEQSMPERAGRSGPLALLPAGKDIGKFFA